MVSASDEPLAGMSILIAEDVWHLAEAMRMVIVRAGGEVVGLAGTVAEAERLVSSCRIDAAVMDVNLHGQLALDLVERLVGSGVKVVVLTGYERPPTLSPEVHDCLTKPVSPEMLIATLTRPRRS